MRHIDKIKKENNENIKSFLMIIMIIIGVMSFVLALSFIPEQFHKNDIEQNIRMNTNMNIKVIHYYVLVDNMKNIYPYIEDVCIISKKNNSTKCMVVEK